MATDTARPDERLPAPEERYEGGRTAGRRGGAVMGDALDVCEKLAAWADVAGVGRHAVVKSDLLHRLIYGGERAPSKTPCPVHKGTWSGCHSGWPGDQWRDVAGILTPVKVEPKLQEWWDAGCRCATHKGSSCTTGWNPDEHCCAEAVPI